MLNVLIRLAGNISCNARTSEEAGDICLLTTAQVHQSESVNGASDNKKMAMHTRICDFNTGPQRLRDLGASTFASLATSP